MKYLKGLLAAITVTIIIVVVLILVNKSSQAFSDSGALIQLASSSPAYFPIWAQTDDNGNIIYPNGYPWLTNIPTRDPLYRTPYLAGIYGNWQYYNYPGLYPYYPFTYRQVVDMNKVKASDSKYLQK